MISIIAAVAKNRAIGFQNKLIYWLPNDLKRFKALTTGHTIIMGRNTFLSLPKGALPNRRNIVLTRSLFSPPEVGGDRGGLSERINELYPGCDVYPSLEEALAHCSKDEEVFIIGCSSVYQQALAIADRLCLTEIDDTPKDADTFFPEYKDEWKESAREDHDIDEKHSFRYSFVDFIRK